MASWFELNKSPQSTIDMVHLMMLENRVQRNSATLSSFPPSSSFLDNNASDRSIYQNLAPLQRSPLQQSQKISSHLMNKTLLLLNNQAQQSRLTSKSRLQDLASLAAHNSLALEIARKGGLPQQQPPRQYPGELPVQLEKSQSSDLVVTCPSDFDVLLGRGGRSNHHIGNNRFRELIRKNRAQYQSLPKLQKIQLAKTLVGVIHGLGGRFLELSRDGDYYVVVPGKRAVEKTSQCLREKRADAHKPISVMSKPSKPEVPKPLNSN